MFTNKNRDLHAIDNVPSPNDNLGMVELADEQLAEVAGGFFFAAAIPAVIAVAAGTEQYAQRTFGPTVVAPGAAFSGVVDAAQGFASDVTNTVINGAAAVGSALPDLPPAPE
jgi:ABC-type transport system involved in cytochrome c biogenesis permease component